MSAPYRVVIRSVTYGHSIFYLGTVSHEEQAGICFFFYSLILCLQNNFTGKGMDKVYTCKENRYTCI